MRYVVLPPNDAFNFWWVVNTKSTSWAYKNMIRISDVLPNAGKLAYDLCDKLNQEEA